MPAQAIMTRIGAGADKPLSSGVLAHRRRELIEEVRRLAVSVITSVAYAIVLWYSYKNFVSPRFAYEGLTYRAPLAAHFSVAIVLTAIVCYLLPARIRNPQDFILWIFWVVAGAPTILLAQYMGTLTYENATKLGVAVALCMLFIRVLCLVTPRVPDRQLPAIGANNVWFALVALSVLVYALLAAAAGVHFRWLSLTDVYDVRSEFGASVSSFPVVGYLLPIVSNVINPIFVARGISNRSWGWILLGAGGQFIIYTTTGQKSVLFSLLALGAIAWFFRRTEEPVGTRLLTGTFYVIAVAVALDRVLHSFLWNSLLIRRFLVIPGSLSVVYVSVFQERAHGNFRGTPLFWLDPVYARGPSYIVGQSLTGNPNNNANVSFLGHGYYNYGYVGMFIEALVFVLFIWAVSAACTGLPNRISALAVIMTTFAISSTNIFTVLTSHGGLALVLICAILPRSGWDRPRPSESFASRQRGRRVETRLSSVRVL